MRWPSTRRAGLAARAILVGAPCILSTCLPDELGFASDQGGGSGGATGGSTATGGGGNGGRGGSEARGGAGVGGSGADAGGEGAEAGTGAESAQGGSSAGVTATGGSGGTTTCGDGAVEGSEGCDDGNTASGDGCSATCAIESGWSCMDEPSTCNRSCFGLPATCGANGSENCCASPLVTGGTFNRSNDANYPATVSDFRLDKFEITVGRFRKFVAAYSQTIIAAGAGKNPNNPSDSGWDTAWNASLPADATALSGTSGVQCLATYQTWTGGNDNRPMNCISWFLAYAFCVWDGGRLPTEAEWNYAAAGGSEQRLHPWGNGAPGANASLAVYGCYFSGTGTCSGVSNIAPVGSVSTGNGKYGQSDLAGNVWEWTLDWYASLYPSSTCNNCANFATTSSRVVRGGSFSGGASSLLSSYRFSTTPTNRNDGGVGARCARTP